MGTLVFIRHGDRHEVRNNGRAALKTLNFYVPPGYTKSGDELPRAKP
jgi:oxalate decarboxylase/phosphoglucose isomerase-like protein (cupin superfamily)